MSSFSGDRVRGLRDAAGLSRQALAARVGCSAQAVQQWEAGEAIPGRGYLAALAAALAVDPVDLDATHPDGTVDYCRAVLFHSEPLPDDALDAAARVLRRIRAERRPQRERAA